MHYCKLYAVGQDNTFCMFSHKLNVNRMCVMCKGVHGISLSYVCKLATPISLRSETGQQTLLNMTSIISSSKLNYSKIYFLFFLTGIAKFGGCVVMMATSSLKFDRLLFHFCALCWFASLTIVISFSTSKVCCTIGQRPIGRSEIEISPITLMIL